MRKRRANQRYEENGLLRKALRKKPPTYAQSPANYKPPPIKNPFAKDFLVTFNPGKQTKLARLLFPDKPKNYITLALPTKSSFLRPMLVQQFNDFFMPMLFRVP